MGRAVGWAAFTAVGLVVDVHVLRGLTHVGLYLNLKNGVMPGHLKNRAILA